MTSFICIRRDRWVMGRCDQCDSACGLGHPLTQEIGTRLWGEGFHLRKPAVGKGMVKEGENPE